MRLVLLAETYIVDPALIREAIFYPSDGTEYAKLVIITEGRKTTMYDDAAVTAWHRLRDLTDEAGDVR